MEAAKIFWAQKGSKHQNKVRLNRLCSDIQGFKVL